MHALSKALAAELTSLLRPLVEDAVRKAVPQSTSSGPAPVQKEWLTNQEAMRYLDLSKATLARYRADGTLKFSKVGGKVYYLFSDVDALLRASRQNAQ